MLTNPSSSAWQHHHNNLKTFSPTQLPKVIINNSTNKNALSTYQQAYENALKTSKKGTFFNYDGKQFKELKNARRELWKLMPKKSFIDMLKGLLGRVSIK